MSVSIRIEPDSHVIVATAGGRLNLDDAMEGARVVWEDPDCAGSPVVWDLRGATLDLKPGEVRDLANFILERQPTPPVPALALVMARDADFGLARMFEVFREHPATEVQVFRDFDRALAWARSVEVRPS